MKKLIAVFFCALFVFSACRTRESEKAKPKPQVKKSGSANIISFVVTKGNVSSSFSIDSSKGTLVLTLPQDHGLKLNELAPAIKISKGANISPESGEVQDFSNSNKITYTVTAEDGTVKTYNASVVILPARGDLEVDSIFVCGRKVENNAVIVGKDVVKVSLEDVSVNFRGQYTPSISVMAPKTLYLSQRGSSGSIVLSTEQTDRWNATTLPSITVKRAKDDEEDQPASDENKILSFQIGDSVGNIDHENGKITCQVPTGEEDIGDGILENLSPVILCSPGAMVTPASGVKRNFKNQSLTYTVRAENNSEKVYTVTVTRKKSDIAKIRSFIIDGKSAAIDHDAGTVKLEMPACTNLTALSPEIRLSFGASSTPNTGVAVNFANSVNVPVEYKVKSEDNNIEKTYKVSVSRTKSRDAHITKFKLAGKDGVIDKEKGEITVEVDKGTDLNMAPDEIECSCFATISPAASEVKDFSRNVTYTVTAENPEVKKNYVVKVTFKKSTEALIKEFKVEGEAANIENGAENANGTITLEVPKNKDLKKIKPEIKISDDAKVSPSSGEEKDFTNPVEYTVTAEDDTTTKKYIVTITHEKDDKALMEEFKIGDAVGVIDHGNEGAAGRIAVEVAKNANLTGVVPTIRVSKGATVNPEPTAAQNFNNQVTYTVTSKDGTKTKQYIVKVTRKKSTEALIKEFKVTIGTEAYIGEVQDGKKIKVLVPFGTDLSTIKPTITVSDDATVEPNSEVQKDFSNAKVVKYTVTAEDGLTKKEYDVRVMKKFPEITTTICGQQVNWNAADRKWEVTIKKLEPNVELKISDIVIRYRPTPTSNATIPDDDEHKRLTADQTKLKVAGNTVIRLFAKLDDDHESGELEIHVTVKDQLP